MEQVRKAIILKNYYPEHQQAPVFKLSIFDEQLGRLDMYCRKRVTVGYPCNGAIIIYSAVKSKFGYFTASFAELVYAPTFSALSDLYFFHQLFELAHFFAPLENCLPEVFIFLCKVYEAPHLVSVQKKLALCRLLYLLGLCPDGAPYQKPHLFSLISSPCNIMLNENKYELAIEDVDAWLFDCISAHPFAHKLKTITFS